MYSGTLAQPIESTVGVSHQHSGKRAFLSLSRQLRKREEAFQFCTNRCAQFSVTFVAVRNGGIVALLLWIAPHRPGDSSDRFPLVPSMHMPVQDLERVA